MQRNQVRPYTILFIYANTVNTYIINNDILYTRYCSPVPKTEILFAPWFRIFCRNFKLQSIQWHICDFVLGGELIICCINVV